MAALVVARMTVGRCSPHGFIPPLGEDLSAVTDGRVGRGVRVQFGLSYEGGPVDPVGGDGLGDDVEGGLFAGGGDEDFVGGAASGHGDVEVADVGGSVEVENRDIDRATLRSGAGAGVGEVDVFGDVLGRDPDAAAATFGADRPVGVDGGDGPFGSVADHTAAVGEESAVVVAGGDLVADVDRVRSRLHAG